MLKFSILRRAIVGAMVTAGLLATATSASAAPVSWVPAAAPGGTARLEAYTLTRGTAPNTMTHTCTPTPQYTQIMLLPQWGTPPTTTFYALQMTFAGGCLPYGGSTLSLKGPMPASVNAGVYTFTGPGFNSTGIIATNPSAPAVPAVTGVWTNHAAPDGISRLKFSNVLIGYTDAAGQDPVRLTATIRVGSDYATSPTLAPQP